MLPSIKLISMFDDTSSQMTDVESIAESSEPQNIQIVSINTEDMRSFTLEIEKSTDDNLTRELETTKVTTHPKRIHVPESRARPRSIKEKLVQKKTISESVSIDEKPEVMIIKSGKKLESFGTQITEHCWNQESNTLCTEIFSLLQLDTYEQDKAMEIDFDQSTQEIGQRDTDATIDKNWLELTEAYLEITWPLYVKAVSLKRGTSENTKTTQILDPLFYFYTKEIKSIKEKEKFVEILFNDQKSQLKMKEEVDYLFNTDQSDPRLLTKIPDLVDPLIYIEFDQQVTEENQQEFILMLRKINKWPKESKIIWKSTQPVGEDQFKVKISIDSKLRSLIEQSKGTIDLGGFQAKVIDDFEIVQCYNCLEYDKCLKSICESPKRCIYCCRSHKSECLVKNRSSQWYCYFCKVKGHTAISKQCPVFLEKIKIKLSSINHKYKHVFLQKYQNLSGPSKSAIERL